MFEEVTIRAADLAAARRFYGTVLATLGVEPSAEGRWGEFGVAAADAGHPPTQGLHVGFAAPSRAHVDEFWRVGTQAGHPDDGPPGPRPQYRDDYYGSFLLDPDGNSAEAVHHGDLPERGVIDHLWIRVSDLRAARELYGGLAARAGLRPATDTAEHAQFVGGGASFSLVAGTPTRNLHVALAAEEGLGPVADPDGNRLELRAPG